MMAVEVSNEAINYVVDTMKVESFVKYASPVNVGTITKKILLTCRNNHG